MKKLNKEIGKKGEDLACQHLREKGYEIVERNWGSKWGEVDIIAKISLRQSPCLSKADAFSAHKMKQKRGLLAKASGLLEKGDVFVFVEVKTKVGEDWGMPEEMINNKKLAQVQRMAETYEPARNHQSRVDVVAVVLNEDLSIKRLNHYECVY